MGRLVGSCVGWALGLIVGAGIGAGLGGLDGDGKGTRVGCGDGSFETVEKSVGPAVGEEESSYLHTYGSVWVQGRSLQVVSGTWSFTQSSEAPPFGSLVAQFS